MAAATAAEGAVCLRVFVSCACRADVHALARWFAATAPPAEPLATLLLRRVWDAEKQEALLDGVKVFGHPVSTITTDELGRCWVGGGEHKLPAWPC